MAYTTKDGHRYENAEIGRAHDRSRGHEPPKEKKAKSEPASEKARAGEEEPIEEVVKAHGPAQETRIEKSDGDEYSVHSTHEDGHKHSSHGHTIHEAHAHSMKAHGEEELGEEEEEEGEEGEGHEESMHSAPPGMPAMPEA